MKTEKGVVTLGATSDRNENSLRISVLTAALGLAEAKINHIDNLRQGLMTVALLLFAGLFGFGLKTSNMLAAISVATAIELFMSLLCALDRRLHRVSHGWRGTSMDLVTLIGHALNNPDKELLYRRYNYRAEEEAEWLSFQPIIYYLLLLGGLGSMVAFSWARQVVVK